MKSKSLAHLILGICLFSALPSAHAQLPSPWQTQDVGAVGATGTANHSNGTFTIEGSGADIWDTADEFRYVYQAAAGDCTIVARVASIENTSLWAKGAVMIRETLDAGSKHAMACVTPGKGIQLISRASTGGAVVQVVNSGLTAPYWLKMARVGNVFTASRSTNGTSWTTIGTATITMTSSVYIGLPVCSHADGTLCTGVFDNVTVTGGVVPEINVKGNAVTIADGDTTPSTTDHTDFGSADISSGTVVRTFTVENTGTAALTVGTVTLSGTHAADFSVTTQPATSVAAAGSTTFQITFNPSATGTRSASLSFSNGDADENPYNYSIQGTGTGVPEVNVTGNGVTIVDGDTTPSTTDHTDFGSADISSGTVVRTFTVENTGTAALTVGTVTLSGTHAADFSVTTQPATSVAAAGSTTFQITFNPSATGTRSASLSFSNDDADENPYNYSIQGTGTSTGGVPEVNVKGNAVTIADGDTTPSTTDHTDFGSADISSGTVVRTFTVENTGTAALAVGTVTLSGTHAADFSVTTQPATSVAAAGSTTFQITFNPSATGTRSASLSFSNDDADENPYNFSLQGSGTSTGAAPVANFQFFDSGSATADSSGNGNTLTFTNGAAWNSAGKTDGCVLLDGTNDYAQAANSTSLNITGNAITVAVWVKFDVVDSAVEMILAKVLSATAHTSPYFSYSLHRLGNGNLRFWVTIGGVGKYVASGTVVANTWYHVAGVYDGAQVKLYIDGAPAGTPVSATGNITGYANPLRLGVNGALGEPLDGRVDDVRVYNVALNSTDIQTLYNGGIGGTPEINVKGNAVTIADGDTTPSTTDHTDFGSADISSGTIVRTFTVENTGTAALTVGTVTLSGTHAADFSVTTQPATSVAAAGSTTFQITFNPSATGTRSASLSFSNDDADENPYNFSIQGAGTSGGGAPEANVTGNGVTIADGDTTPSAADHTDFGSVAVSSGNVTRTFTIGNSGTAALTVNTVSVSGTHAADFAVTVQPASSVAAGGNTTFQAQFDPSASGLRTASLSFGNGDADENPYNFSIQGTGTTVGPIESINGSAHQVAISVGTAARQSWIGFGWGANSSDPAITAFPQVQTHIQKLCEDLNAKVIRFFTPRNSTIFLNAYKPYWDLVSQHGIDTVYVSEFIYTSSPDGTPAQVAAAVQTVQNAGVPIHYISLQNEPDGNPNNAVTGGTSVYANTQQTFRNELDNRSLQSTRVVSLEWRHPTIGGVTEFDVLNAANKISPTGPVDMGCLHIYDKSSDDALYDNRYLTKGVGLISTETGNNGTPNCQARFLAGVNHGTRVEMIHYGLIATATPNSEQLQQALVDWNGAKRPWYGGVQVISQNLVRGTVMRLCLSNDATAELPTNIEQGMIRNQSVSSGYNPRQNVIAGRRTDGKWVVAAVNTTFGSNTPSPYSDGHYAALLQQLTVTIPELDGQALTFSAKRADINGNVTGPFTVNMQDGVVRFTLAAGETIAMTTN